MLRLALYLRVYIARMNSNLYDIALLILNNIINLDFTSKETVKYQRRYEEGYDIPDSRYEQWLTVYHPEVVKGKENGLPSTLSSVDSPLSCETTSTTTASVMYPPQSLFTKYLKTSMPKYKLPVKEPKTSARILTSVESLHAVQEKNERRMKQLQ